MEKVCSLLLLLCRSLCLLSQHSKLLETARTLASYSVREGKVLNVPVDRLPSYVTVNIKCRRGETYPVTVFFSALTRMVVKSKVEKAEGTTNSALWLRWAFSVFVEFPERYMEISLQTCCKEDSVSEPLTATLRFV